MSFELRPGNQGYAFGVVLFQDRSGLYFREYHDSIASHVSKLMYSYHYQDADQQLIFRYDNAPHHPEISSHPHHKHGGDQSGEQIVAAQPPGLPEVLREIERQTGLAQRLASCMVDPRDPAKVQHSLDDIIRFRIMMDLHRFRSGQVLMLSGPLFEGQG